jgi:subtilase family serine protease
MTEGTVGRVPFRSGTDTGSQLHRRSKSRWWRPVAALAAVGLLVPLSAASPAGAAMARPTPLVISGPLVSIASAPRVPLHTAFLGNVAASKVISGAVALKPRNESGLTSFIAAVSNPHSSMYHQYLPRGAYSARFGPTAATIAAVTEELRTSGLTVSGKSADGLLVYFHGAANTVESTFHTGIAQYRLPNGTLGMATTSAVRLPASIAKSVTTVVGLDNLVHAQPAGILRAPVSMKGKYPAAVGGKVPHVASAPNACGDATAAANAFGGLTDSQIASAYGAFGLYSSGDTGAGQAVDVYELEPYLPSDLNTFDKCYFTATQAAAMAGRQHQIAVDGGQPTGPGSGESILDVEDVAALAPSATLNVYEAPNNTFGGLDEYTAIVDNDDAHVVTSSWATCEQAEQAAEPGVQAEENFLFEQAAAQGQSVFSAAGDTGNDECNEFRDVVPPPDQNPLSLLDPGSQPYVVSVGGTTIDDAATTPAQEHVWNDGAEWGAGGGGISESWAMPSWQRAATDTAQNAAAVTAAEAVETSMASTAGPFDTPTFCLGTITPAPSGCRETPDVSAQADEFTGAVTIYANEFKAPGSAVSESGWITIGGTSSASPIWAALTADINASPTCSTQLVNGTPDAGFISPLLYAIAGNASEYAASFNDITSGNNDDFGFDNGAAFRAEPGYDMASGLGSPRLTDAGGTDGLAFFVCSYATELSPPTITSLSPTSGPTAAGTFVVITGTGFHPGPSADVASVQVGGATASAFVVSSNTQVTATFPAGSAAIPVSSPSPQDGAGPANVVVTLTNGTSSKSGPSSLYEFVDENGGSQTLPSVTGISPYGGSQTTPTPVRIFGSGFSGSPVVTFGGVDATSVTVISPFEIRATPPVFSGSVACHGGLPAGETSTNDICQSQVVVTETNGSSKTGTILPPYEGPVLPLSNMAVPLLPAGCGCEEAPVPSEFDFVPNPTITSISTTTSNPSTLANEFGGTTITVTGKGFDPMTLSNADFGNPTLDSSLTQSFSFVSGTEIQLESPGTVTAPNFNPTVNTTTLPFSVTTLAGSSSSSPVTYAGVPDVTNLTGGVELFPGLHVGPDTGGTNLTVTGNGFQHQLIGLEYGDLSSPFSLGTQYTFNVHSNTSLGAETLQQNPAEVIVQACTVTGCSNSTNANFLLYPPGNPTVSASTPAKGPAHGGTVVSVSGQNLGCVLAVNFGTAQSELVSNATQLLDCGSTTQVLASAPPGKAGTTVKVSVLTVESFVTGFGFSKATTKAEFTYAKSAPSSPSNLMAKAGVHSVAVSWAPPESTGGSPITGYRITAKAKGHASVPIKLGAGARKVTIAGLAAGVKYTISVNAINALGNGLPATATVEPKA